MPLDPSTALTVLASILGGGGLKVVFDYFTRKREFDAKDKDGLIQQLNNLINEERKRCDEEMSKLRDYIVKQDARISHQEAHIVQLQTQLLQLQLTQPKP